MKAASPYLRALAAWIVIIAAESVHGTIRELFISPAVGDLLARQISFFTGLIIIFCIALLLIRWIGARALRDLLLIGLLWSVLTFCFEIWIGILVFGLTWDQILKDYDLFSGRLMTLGLIAMLLMPLAAKRIREGVG